MFTDLNAAFKNAFSRLPIPWNDSKPGHPAPAEVDRTTMVETPIPHLGRRSNNVAPD